MNPENLSQDKPWPWREEKPHVCPVCKGRGIVPADFYESRHQFGTIAAPRNVPCRTCNGMGIVWR